MNIDNKDIKTIIRAARELQLGETLIGDLEKTVVTKNGHPLKSFVTFTPTVLDADSPTERDMTGTVKTSDTEYQIKGKIYPEGFKDNRKFSLRKTLFQGLMDVKARLSLGIMNFGKKNNIYNYDGKGRVYFTDRFGDIYYLNSTKTGCLSVNNDLCMFIPYGPDDFDVFAVAQIDPELFDYFYIINGYKS